CCRTSPPPSSVAVIDIANNTVIATIPNLGDLSIIGGIAVAPDGSRVYVVEQGGPCTGTAWVNVHVIDVASTTVVDTIQVSGSDSSYALAITLDGSQLYLGTGTGDSSAVTVIDITTGATTATIPTPPTFPLVIAITPDGSRA